MCLNEWLERLILVIIIARINGHLEVLHVTVYIHRLYKLVPSENSERVTKSRSNLKRETLLKGHN